MKISLILGATALAVSTTALAQRPVVYPLRSQTAATQGVDNAYCYWQARRETGVDTARQSQRPSRTKPLQFAADGGRGASEPPLPAPHAGPGGASAAKPASHVAEVPAAASASAASIPAARSAQGDAGEASDARAQTAAAASAAVASGASPGLPPLPPPEPPMERYWQAYGDCMQGRGYGVQ